MLSEFVENPNCFIVDTNAQNGILRILSFRTSRSRTHRFTFFLCPQKHYNNVSTKSQDPVRKILTFCVRNGMMEKDFIPSSDAVECGIT
nr:MAG TPA: hypothetical protein [Caudoviricetes sp.]